MRTTNQSNEDKTIKTCGCCGSTLPETIYDDYENGICDDCQEND